MQAFAGGTQAADQHAAVTSYAPWYGDMPVWRAGQEVTQYTYFQQAGGQPLPAPAVEITYGLERILMALQARPAAIPACARSLMVLFCCAF